jgi:hypothetical protein
MGKKAIFGNDLKEDMPRDSVSKKAWLHTVEAIEDLD